MAADLAMEAAFDLSHIGNVIEMAMRQQQKLQIHISRREPLASSIGCVEENRALRGFKQIAIRFENAAAKCFRSHCI